MKNTEKSKFADLITNVMAYYSKDASSFVLDLWWNACKGFDLEEIQKAMQTHATDAEFGKYSPKVSDVVRVLHGTTTDRAALAWGKAFSAMSAVGAYQDVVFDDPAIHAAIVDCGGWQKMCRSDMDELSYLQHRFCQSHKAYTQRETFDYPRILGGDRSPDAEYMKFNRQPPKPAIVGDPKKAALVMSNGTSGGPQITFQNVCDIAVRAIDVASKNPAGIDS